MPVVGPLWRRWVPLCDEATSWPKLVLAAEAEDGMALGLGTATGKVYERGKFLL